MTKEQRQETPPWRVAFFEVRQRNFNGQGIETPFFNVTEWEEWARMWREILTLEEEGGAGAPHFLLCPRVAPWNRLSPESQPAPRYVELGQSAERLYGVLGDELLQVKDIPTKSILGSKKREQETSVVVGVFFKDSPVNVFSIETVLDAFPFSGADLPSPEVRFNGEELFFKGVSGCAARLKIGGDYPVSGKVEANIIPPPGVSAIPYSGQWRGRDALWTAVAELAPLLAGDENGQEAMGEISRFANALAGQSGDEKRFWGERPLNELSGVMDALPLAAAVIKTLKRACVTAALSDPIIAALGDSAYFGVEGAKEKEDIGTAASFDYDVPKYAGRGERYLPIFEKYEQQGETLMGELLRSGAMDGAPWEMPVEKDRYSLYAYCWNMFREATEDHIPLSLICEREGSNREALLRGMFSLYMHGWAEGTETTGSKTTVSSRVSMERALRHAVEVLRTFCCPFSYSGHGDIPVPIEQVIGREWAGVLGTCALRLSLLVPTDVGLNTKAEALVGGAWFGKAEALVGGAWFGTAPEKGSIEERDAILFRRKLVSGNCQSPWFPQLAGAAEEFLRTLETTLEGEGAEKNLDWVDCMFRSVTYDGENGIDYSVVHYPYLSANTFQKAREEAERLKDIRDRVFLKAISDKDRAEYEKSGEIMF